MTNDQGSDPALIERDIQRTQDQIGETIGKLEEQLRPQEIARSIVGDDGNEAAKEALEIARRNPVPVALIAVGLIWLLAAARTRDGKTLTDRFMNSQRSGKPNMLGESTPSDPPQRPDGPGRPMGGSGGPGF